MENQSKLALNLRISQAQKNLWYSYKNKRVYGFAFYFSSVLRKGLVRGGMVKLNAGKTPERRNVNCVP